MEENYNTINEFGRSLRFVLWGFLITMVVQTFINSYGFLAIFGLIFIFAGFRNLRKENKWYTFGYVISIVRLMVGVMSIILSTTIWLEESGLWDMEEFAWVNFGIALLELVQLISLYAGVRNCQKKNETKPDARGVLWIVLAKIIAGRLAISGPGDLGVFGVILLVMEFGGLFVLFKESKRLGSLQFSIKDAKKRISNSGLGAAILGFVVVVSIPCIIWGTSYRMNWQEVTESEDNELKQIKAHLIELGAPEDIVADLNDEDIRACKNATKVTCRTENSETAGVQAGLQKVGNLPIHYYEDYDGHKNTMDATMMVVATGDSKGIVFQHLNCKKIVDHSYQTYGIKIEMDIGDEEWTYGRDIEARLGVFGQVLYEKDGKRFASNYHSFENAWEKTNTNKRYYCEYPILVADDDNFYIGATTRHKQRGMFATFSIPDEADSFRCYYSYTVEPESEWLYQIISNVELSGVKWTIGNSCPSARRTWYFSSGDSCEWGYGERVVLKNKILEAEPWVQRESFE
ncbi:MAG: hypothetical protein K6G65_07805 [Lachnospiraceae bacterium]|nr:hypothetical protein [Lachnospiraceae bacterium]